MPKQAAREDYPSIQLRNHSFVEREDKMQECNKVINTNSTKT